MQSSSRGNVWSNRPPRPPKSDGERFETMVMQHLKMLTAKVGSMDIVLKELYHVLKGSMPEETENKLSDSEDMYEKDGRFVLSGHSLQDLETLKRAPSKATLLQHWYGFEEPPVQVWVLKTAVGVRFSSISAAKKAVAAVLAVAVRDAAGVRPRHSPPSPQGSHPQGSHPQGAPSQPLSVNDRFPPGSHPSKNGPSAGNGISTYIRALPCPDVGPDSSLQAARRSAVSSLFRALRRRFIRPPQGQPSQWTWEQLLSFCEHVDRSWVGLNRLWFTASDDFLSEEEAERIEARTSRGQPSGAPPQDVPAGAPNQAPPAPSGSGKKQKSRGNNGSVQKKSHERGHKQPPKQRSTSPSPEPTGPAPPARPKGKPGAAKPQAPPTTADRLEQPEEAHASPPYKGPESLGNHESLSPTTSESEAGSFGSASDASPAAVSMGSDAELSPVIDDSSPESPDSFQGLSTPAPSRGATKRRNADVESTPNVSHSPAPRPRFQSPDRQPSLAALRAVPGTPARIKRSSRPPSTPTIPEQKPVNTPAPQGQGSPNSPDSAWFSPSPARSETPDPPAGGAKQADDVDDVDMESTGSSISGRLDFSAQPLNGQPSAPPSPASPAGSASAPSDAVGANDF